MSKKINSSDDLFEEELKRMAKNNLVKHLDGRTLNMDNVKSWGEMILNDLGNDLKKKYPDFCFGLFFWISNKTNYSSNAQSIMDIKTDKNIIEIYDRNDFYSEVRIFACKKYSPMPNFKENIPYNYLVRINRPL